MDLQHEEQNIDPPKTIVKTTVLRVTKEQAIDAIKHALMSGKTNIRVEIVEFDEEPYPSSDEDRYGSDEEEDFDHMMIRKGLRPAFDHERFGWKLD